MKKNSAKVEVNYHKPFGIEKFDKGWAFTFGTFHPHKIVVGIGKHNQRYFESKEEIVEELESLGIKQEEYAIKE